MFAIEKSEAVDVKLSEMPVSLDRDADSYNELYDDDDPAGVPIDTKANPYAETTQTIESPPFRISMFSQDTRAYITLAVLCFINLINYGDRYTIAGVLKQVAEFYKLEDDNTKLGLLQTSFVMSFMIMAPVFGYLGDRYNRKIIMIGGITFWCLTTLTGSFIPAEYFGLFLFLRALVGIGEASYSTIAPTIIADLFKGTQRSRMLACFYFAIPVGSGMGYIVGSEVAVAFQDWRWSMRVTPILGIIAVFATVLFVREPPRGEADGAMHLRPTNLKEDLKDLAKNKSYILSSCGSTCVAFAIGSLAWWAPTYMADALAVSGHSVNKDSVGVKFGIITCLAGISGVLFGSLGAQYLTKYTRTADPLVCAAGLITGVPLLFLGCLTASSHADISWTLIFFSVMLLSFNWALVADMLLYVVIPNRRSMAQALQILFSHALGDAFSPYIIGAVSDRIRGDKPMTPLNLYQSLQYALYITVFVLVIGGVCFLWTSWYIVEDRARCEKLTRTEDGDTESIHSEQSLPNPVSGQINDDLSWSYSDTRQLVA